MHRLLPYVHWLVSRDPVFFPRREGLHAAQYAAAMTEIGDVQGVSSV